MAKAKQDGQTGRKPPVFECKMGRIRGSVWENEGKDGIWYSVTFNRVYRDGENNYKFAASFGRDDLLVVAEVARTCFIAIMAMKPAVGGDVVIAPPNDPM